MRRRVELGKGKSGAPDDNDDDDDVDHGSRPFDHSAFGSQPSWDLIPSGNACEGHAPGLGEYIFLLIRISFGPQG